MHEGQQHIAFFQSRQVLAPPSHLLLVPGQTLLMTLPPLVVLPSGCVLWRRRGHVRRQALCLLGCLLLYLRVCLCRLLILLGLSWGLSVQGRLVGCAGCRHGRFWGLGLGREGRGLWLATG